MKQFITYKSFQKRLNLIKLPNLKEDISLIISYCFAKPGKLINPNSIKTDSLDAIAAYIEQFDNVLASVDWDEQKLLQKIDQNW